MVEVTGLAAKNGMPTLRAELPAGQRVFLHSSYDPEAEAKNWASSLQPRPNSLLVLFGLGMGYQLKALLSEVEPHSQVIVVEPNPETVKLAVGWEGNQEVFCDPRVHLVDGWENFKTTYQQIATPWDNLFFCRIAAYAKVYGAEYRSFIDKLKREINSVRTNICTASKFASQWQTNLFKNLRFLPQSARVADLFDRFSDKPAIIVSAGPSLMKNIDQLSRAQGKALIVAVGTVAKLLLKRGIRPDFVMSFDGGLPNYLHHFQGLQMPDVPLVYDPAVHSQVVEEHQGPRVMMLVQDGNCWLEEVLGHPIGLLKVGNSIANTALDFAYRLGANPIVLVGQDIAYGEAGSHAESTFSDGYDRSLQLSDEEQWVEGIDGGMVRTDNRMLNYLHCFEESIRTLKEHCIVIDATEGGARIAGTRVQPLGEVLDCYCRQELCDELTALKQSAACPPQYDLAELTAYLAAARQSLARLIPICHTGMKGAEKLIQHYSTNQPCKVEKVLARLEKVDRKLKSGSERYALIHYLTSVVEMIRRSPDHAASDELSISQHSYQLYSILKQAFEFALPLIEETVVSLEMQTKQEPPAAFGESDPVEMKGTSCDLSPSTV